MLPCDCGRDDDVHLFGICTIYFWGPLVLLLLSLLEN